MKANTIHDPSPRVSLSCRHGPAVLTDRHGFVLEKGDTVEKVADGTTFPVSSVLEFEGEPVVFVLADGRGGEVDASLVMIAEQKKRASFCARCFNNFL